MPAATTVHPRVPRPAGLDPRPPAARSLILGLDPGLHRTGYGVLSMENGRPRLREAGVLVTPQQGDLGRRLQRLFREVEGLLRDLRPAAVALEDLFVHHSYPRAAIVLGHARGIIWLAAAVRGVPVLPLAPSAVKRAVTGSGRASKTQVQAAMRTLLGVRRVADPHAADALALAYAGLYRLTRARR
jgi:crossover junction endodeoxyribonuclease RuvC